MGTETTTADFDEWQGPKTGESAQVEFAIWAAANPDTPQELAQLAVATFGRHEI